MERVCTNKSLLQRVQLQYVDIRKIKWHSPMPREVKTILIATAVTGLLVLVVALAGGLRD